MIDLNHKHLILKGVMTDILTVGEVENVINDLVDKLGMKYVKTMPVNPMAAYEPDENCGVTGVGIITTSHIIIHTWDDTKYFQADIYSCKDFNAYQIINLLKSHKLENKDCKLLDRNGEIKIIS
jgi:S-adenosylmethionine/arginine decarboxylase-like enzyme